MLPTVPQGKNPPLWCGVWSKLFDHLLLLLLLLLCRITATAAYCYKQNSVVGLSASFRLCVCMSVSLFVSRAKNNISQGSVETWFRNGEIFYWYCVTNLLLSLPWKNFLNQSMSGEVICKNADCLKHRPAEKWKIRLRSNVWRAVTVITASRYDSRVQ